jgi:hypothetical protein
MLQARARQGPDTAQWMTSGRRRGRGIPELRRGHGRSGARRGEQVTQAGGAGGGGRDHGNRG